MSVTYGFYNSKNGDRRYNALQMGMMFDGFIKNGIVMNAENYPGHLMVKESDPYSMTVKVLPGKAWWLFTWTLNDSPLDLTLDPADTVNSRIDAVVLDIDQRDDARTNSFKIVKGNPEAEAKKPSLASEAPHIQIPLAYITVSANATSVRQADIENCIGTDACPYVTGFLKSQSTEELFAQWQDQFKKVLEELAAWETDAKDKFTTWESTTKSEFETWESTTKSEFETWQTGVKTDFEQWRDTEKTNYETWRDEIKDTLETDKTEFEGWIERTKTSFADQMNLWIDEQETKFSDRLTELDTGFTSWETETKNNFDNWYSEFQNDRSDWETWRDAFETETADWRTGQENSFTEWFNGIKALYSEDQLGDIITQLQNKADKGHTHELSDIKGLTEALESSGKITSLEDRIASLEQHAILDTNE